MTKTGLLPTLFLAALLVGAQGAFALHAFEHDPGAPPGKVCGTCVTGGQLAAGTLDTYTDEPSDPARHHVVGNVRRTFESVHTTPVRQRGPPSFH